MAIQTTHTSCCRTCPGLAWLGLAWPGPPTLEQALPVVHVVLWQQQLQLAALYGPQRLAPLAAPPQRAIHHPAVPVQLDGEPVRRHVHHHLTLAGACRRTALVAPVTPAQCKQDMLSRKQEQHRCVLHCSRHKTAFSETAMLVGQSRPADHCPACAVHCSKQQLTCRQAQRDVHL
jgi:hypothetical protein